MRTASQHGLSLAFVAAAAACLGVSPRVQAAGGGTAAAGAPVTAKRTSATVNHRRVPLIDPTKDDVAEYDDPVVREAAIGALGHEDGGVVVVDPNT